MADSHVQHIRTWLEELLGPLSFFMLTVVGGYGEPLPVSAMFSERPFSAPPETGMRIYQPNASAEWWLIMAPAFSEGAMIGIS